MSRPGYRRGPQPQRRKGSLLFGLVIAAVAFFGYISSSQTNPVTGEAQRVNLSPDQEIALGLHAVPTMAAQHGGIVESGAEANDVKRVGKLLVLNSAAKSSPYEFDFHLLADTQVVNAFALPGGQIFITRALLRKLETEGQLAGVLGHEIGHVLERHGAEHMAKQQLTQGLTAAVATASDNPNSTAIAQAVGSMVNMKYGRDDELESDKWGVKLLAETGYDPRALIGVMKVLEVAGGGRSQPEFMSSHPSPDNRIGRIEEAIARQFPGGIPSGLKP